MQSNETNDKRESCPGYEVPGFNSNWLPIFKVVIFHIGIEED